MLEPRHYSVQAGLEPMAGHLAATVGLTLEDPGPDGVGGPTVRDVFEERLFTTNWCERLGDSTTDG